MKSKMTTEIATKMIERIEALEEEIAQIYADADTHYTPTNSGSELRSIIKERRAARDAEFMASGMLAAFDVAEDQ